MRWIIPNFVVLLLTALSDSFGPWTAVLLLWTNLFLYAVSKLKERTFLAAFLATFLLFLMTQDTFERLIGYAPISVSPNAHSEIVAVILLGLSGLIIGYAGIGRVFSSSRRSIEDPDLLLRETTKGSVLGNANVRSGALIIFFISIPISIIGQVRNILMVQSTSYADSYTTEFIAAQDGVFGTVVQYAGEFASVSFAIYLATLPIFTRARLPLALWVTYAGLHLFSGRRREVAVLILFLVAYAIIRSRITPSDPWMTKRRIQLFLVTLPIILVTFAGLEAWRGIGATQGGLSLSAIPDFLYGQGVSIKVLENVILYGHALPDQNYVLEFTRSGILPRVLGIEVLEGNSIRRAFEGGSLPHSLSYLVLGEVRYLSGMATGSSFIAEWYVEFGLAGVFAVSTVYGLILRWMESFGTRGSGISNALRLLIAQSILWAPRGASAGFITTLIAPTTLATLMAVLVLAWVSNSMGRPRLRTRPINRDEGRPHATRGIRV